MASAVLPPRHEANALDLKTFVGIIRRHAEMGHPIIFFLGAGCSIDAGVPSGAQLREKWIRELGLQPVDPATAEKWEFAKLAALKFASDPASASDEFRKLFYDTEPTVGHHAYAQLCRRDSDRFRVIITTNFDELVEKGLDAASLPQRTYVIANHNGVALRACLCDVRRPVVVKLHGDPVHGVMNTPKEIEDIPLNLAEVLRQRESFHGAAYVFIGWSGSEPGVLKWLHHLNPAAEKLYFCNDNPTKSLVFDWLESKRFRWVNERDFNKIMAALGKPFSHHMTSLNF